MEQSEYKIVTSAVVNVTVSSSANSFVSERRFQKDLSVSALKAKLELITGGSATSMQLQVFSCDNQLLCNIDDDSRLLGSYPVDDGCRIHVIDKSHQLGEFEDTSKVEKFELSEDQYASRTDSVRAFKQKMKMGRFDEEAVQKKEEEHKAKEKNEEELAKTMQINNRCEVKVVGQPTKRGTVMYIGNTDFKPGVWVGIKYDEPMGKNDGSVQGKRYFECPAKYGGFVRPSQVTVGDFPEEDFMDMDDDEM